MILAIFAVALADDAALLASANTALANEDFPAAEAGYRALLDAGCTSGDVWYDLGNVLYRQDRRAEASLAWRNAAARMPRDPDVQANLDFVRRSFSDGLEVGDPRPWFAPWQGALTPDEGVWLGAAFAGLGLVLVAARKRAPHAPLGPLGAASLGLGALLAAGGHVESAMPPVGVILASEVTASSDLGGGVDLFTLHAGAEVKVDERAAGRVLVSLSDGRKGWLPEGAVGVVDPTRPSQVL